MRLGTKIIIIGFILFTVGVIGNEVTDQLSSKSIHSSDIPLWIKLINNMPTYLVFVGIITTITGFIIHRIQYTGGMRDMRK